MVDLPNHTYDQSDLIQKTEDGPKFEKLLELLYPNQKVELIDYEFKEPNTVILKLFKPIDHIEMKLTINELQS